MDPTSYWLQDVSWSQEIYWIFLWSMKIQQNWRQPLPYAAITVRYCHSKFTILYFTTKTKSILIHNYFRNKSIIVEKYWLPAVRIQNPAGLRRWNYLPHPSSLPLWISWAVNEGARECAQLLYLGGSLLPPCREAGCLSPLHRGRQQACLPAGGRQAPTRGLRAKTIYICLM